MFPWAVFRKQQHWVFYSHRTQIRGKSALSPVATWQATPHKRREALLFPVSSLKQPAGNQWCCPGTRVVTSHLSCHPCHLLHRTAVCPVALSTSSSLARPSLCPEHPSSPRAAVQGHNKEALPAASTTLLLFLASRCGERICAL